MLNAASTIYGSVHSMSLAEWRANWKARWSASLKKRGFASTLSLLPGLVIATIKGDPDKRFDRRYHVDTAGILRPAEPLRYGNGYAPSRSRLFFEMLRRVSIEFEEYIFVDFGCGKGKTLLLASRYPFKRIIGVELWPELLAVAEKNIASYTGMKRCRDIELSLTDASKFHLPAEPSILYFFDPFEASTMRRVLENIENSLSRSPRDVFIIYCEPERPDILDGCKFLNLLVRTPHYSVYGATLCEVGT